MISKILNTLKVLAINLATFLLLLLVANWGCGVYLKKTKPGSRDLLPNYAADPAHAKAIFKDYNSVQHRYEAFVGWKVLPYKGETLHINEKGIRTHTSPPYAKTKEVTVFFFGGSTMWGEGSDDDHTIPSLVNKSNPSYEIFNHAQLAYNTRQELDALISLCSKNETADVVVFYDGVNDAAFLCPKDIEELPAHRLVPMFRQKIYVEKTNIIQELVVKALLENILKVAQRFSGPSKKSEPLYDCLSKPGKAEEIAEIFMNNWEMAHELVTTRGGKFIAVLQPAALVGNPQVNHLKLDPELKQNFQKVYRLIQQKIKERNHDWIVDLSDSFDGKEYIFIDFCHVSSNGNQIMADKISPLIRTKINQ